MGDVLRLYREATGSIYDGPLHDIHDLQPVQGDKDGSESDVDVPVVEFSRDSEEEGEGETNERVENENPRGDTDGNNWSATTLDVKVNPFEEESGPCHEPDGTAEPYDYFSLIISEGFYTLASRETNGYAKWRQEQANKEDTV